MFKQLFQNLVQFCVSVIQDKELEDVCRQNALELMATFAEYAPSMCRKDPSFTSDMITQCLSLMTEIGEDDDDAAEWLSSDDVRYTQAPSYINLRLTSTTVAGPGRERPKPRCWRAGHGPTCQ